MTATPETMPETMRAIVPRGPGGPEVLALVERPVPRPGPGMVLIRTDFAGVNRHDCNQRARGHGPQGATDILGLEVSGRVVATGAGVDPALAGSRVAALTDGGGYGEYTLADAALLLPEVQGLSPVEAAALPEALFTLELNLVETGRIAAGEWLLVHGGGGGIGTTAIPFALALGAQVAVTAGSDEKCARALARGAALAVNYRSDDFVARMLQATGGRGADLILDTVGGALAARNLAALAPDGRLLHLSPAGPDFSVPLAAIMSRRALVTGAYLRALPAPRKALLARSIARRVWPLATGALRPVIDRVLPLSQAAKAHAVMENAAHFGKIMLDCRA